MNARIAALVALTLLPATAKAQGLAASAPLFDIVKGYLVKSAEMVSESNYSFKPTPEVRSFGQIIGHLANENYAMCATAKGMPNPMGTQDFEKTTEKAALVKALKDAVAYCDAVYKMADASLSAQAEMFGMKMSRLGWALLNVSHDFEHYGNLVTYLRLKGMVPPSSQRATTP